MKVCRFCFGFGGAFSKTKGTKLIGVSWLVQTQLSKRYFGQPAAQTHPHLIKDGEVTPGITKYEYKHRREQLLQLLLHSHESYKDKNHIVIVPSAVKKIMTGIVPYPFHQNTDFWYLSGFLEPDSLLIIQCDGKQSRHSSLFVPKRDPEKEMWDGPRSGIDGTTQLTGVDCAFTTDQLGGYLNTYICDNSDFIIWYDENSVTNASLQNGVIKDFIKEQKHLTMINVSPMLQALRCIKSPTEVELMRKSCDIASRSFIEVMKYSYPGVNEHYLYAKMDFECRIRDAEILAYPPVVAGGNRANTIHYVNNNQIINNGELVLMDAGCEYHGYCSDITRTWPVSGKFTDAQRCLYDIVYRVQKQCIDVCVPEQSINRIFQYMLTLMGKELQKIGLISKNCDDLINETMPFCRHHVGHYLGMDLHDTVGITCSQKLQPGMVITVEPGLYIPEDRVDLPAELRGIGIRIEDDVLITSSKPEVLSKAAPKDPDEIERIMAGS